MRASSDAMDSLHAILADGLTEELRRNLERSRLPKRIQDPADETKTIANPEWEPLSPKTAAVAAKFLKDNGIDAPAKSPRMSSLASQLRDLDFDEARAN